MPETDKPRRPPRKPPSQEGVDWAHPRRPQAPRTADLKGVPELAQGVGKTLLKGGPL